MKTYQIVCVSEGHEPEIKAIRPYESASPKDVPMDALKTIRSIPKIVQIIMCEMDANEWVSFAFADRKGAIETKKAYRFDSVHDFDAWMNKRWTSQDDYY